MPPVSSRRMTPARTLISAIAAGLVGGHLYWAQPLIEFARPDQFLCDSEGQMIALGRAACPVRQLITAAPATAWHSFSAVERVSVGEAIAYEASVRKHRH